MKLVTDENAQTKSVAGFVKGITRLARNENMSVRYFTSMFMFHSLLDYESTAIIGLKEPYTTMYRC